ncbi:AraC family transcriptional regulator [Rodentibacter trehalosifermentans]|uniref:AraC family transcriptional regulator n=1 Tax=Rodentibacter trehalosifermentans TaxID=1908263 RepID=A0A1V3IUA9_9PAST|nr:helix-turn-helix transcriptional regulator [Rodentibacter trehalosifermentans]OOF45838.1 AraC family transcriptional regulator [Rodentibacter trehalosifermentans]OOF46131.1 AraC family transcriptional regulator [Rodentibacter trehalosifermentans]OOF48763.1 AraC family transcriptional regulator [Rodentibacter trehalosifermentans]
MVKNGNIVEKITHTQPILEICLFSEFKQSDLQADELIRQQLSGQHRFDFYVWLWVTKGECWHELDFKKVQQCAGEWLLIYPQQVHHFLSMEGWDGWGMSFPAEWLSPQWGKIEQILPQRHFVTTEQSELLEPTLKQLKQYRYFNWRERNETLLLKSQLQSFMLLLQTLYVDNHCTVKQQNPRWQQFSQLLEQYFCEQHQVQFYAKQLACSEKTLSTTCLTYAGLPTKILINQRLLLEAKRLLVHTSQSIKHIALQLGFEEATHFNKFFKKNEQCTPKTFREQYNIGRKIIKSPNISRYY